LVFDKPRESIKSDTSLIYFTTLYQLLWIYRLGWRMIAWLRRLSREGYVPSAILRNYPKICLRPIESKTDNGKSKGIIAPILMRYYAMRMNGGVEVQHHAFLNSALDEVSGQLHVSTALPPAIKALGIHRIGGCVGPRAGLDATDIRQECWLLHIDILCHSESRIIPKRTGKKERKHKEKREKMKKLK
jgi:hypothetical protein